MTTPFAPDFDCMRQILAMRSDKHKLAVPVTARLTVVEQIALEELIDQELIVLQDISHISASPEIMRIFKVTTRAGARI